MIAYLVKGKSWAVLGAIMSVSRIIIVLVVVVLAGGGYYYYSSQGDAPGASSAGELKIKLGNNVYSNITALEFSPAGTATYVASGLPEGGLGAGNFHDLVIAGGSEQCRYDLRFTLEDGTKADRMNVDLCAATFYHFESQ